MRKSFIVALIAATAIPAIATAQPGTQRRDHPQARQQQPVRAVPQDHRMDWQRYRRDNRNVFRQKAYVGPRGYRYRVLTPGYRLAPPYYSARYVIADPYRYRLPRVTGRQRWVRYGNDVVLVDTRNGRVVTVYQKFFW